MDRRDHLHTEGISDVKCLVNTFLQSFTKVRCKYATLYSCTGHGRLGAAFARHQIVIPRYPLSCGTTYDVRAHLHRRRRSRQCRGAAAPLPHPVISRHASWFRTQRQSSTRIKRVSSSAVGFFPSTRAATTPRSYYFGLQEPQAIVLALSSPGAPLSRCFGVYTFGRDVPPECRKVRKVEKDQQWVTIFRAVIAKGSGDRKCEMIRLFYFCLCVCVGRLVCGKYEVDYSYNKVNTQRDREKSNH